METLLTWKPELYNGKHSFVFNYGKGLIELLEPKRNERILDLGCGAGQLTHEIAQTAQDVIGMDYSPEMIAAASEKYDKIEFRVMDASDFTFEKPFDAIFSNAALHWVLDYKGAARCMFNNLRNGGRLVIEMGGKGNIKTIIDTLQETLFQWGYKSQSTYCPWYFPTIGEYATVLESAGFRVVFARHFDRPTELADAETGISDWLNMFGDGFFSGVKDEDREKIIDEVGDRVKSTLFREGKWYADYKRLRMVARKL